MVSGKWGFVGKMPPCARRVTPAQSEDLVDSTPPPSPKSAPPPPAIPPSQLQMSHMSVPALERMAFLRKPSLATATPPLRHIPAPATLATPEVSAPHNSITFLIMPIYQDEVDTMAVDDRKPQPPPSPALSRTSFLHRYRAVTTLVEWVPSDPESEEPMVRHS